MPDNDDLFRAIHEKCQFEKLSVEKQYSPEMTERAFNPGFTMFRKGKKYIPLNFYNQQRQIKTSFYRYYMYGHLIRRKQWPITNSPNDLIFNHFQILLQNSVHMLKLSLQVI